MRCPYCYNPALVNGPGRQSEEDILDFLRKRQGMLDGVVLSGGECTLYPALVELCRKIKKLGYLIKLDTNGSKPAVIRQLIEDKLIDYAALDFKATETKYPSMTGMPSGFQLFQDSLQTFIDSEIPFEVRTTVHPDLLSAEEINEMAQFLKTQNYTGTLYLQHFLNADETIGNLSAPQNQFDKEKLTETIPIGLRNF